MVVGAHPDDNDFIAGATVAKAVAEGSEVVYIIATRGDRGSRDQEIKHNELIAAREKEQQAAADVLGVKTVEFLTQKDGEVEANLALKEDIVRCIRKYKPEMVITMDPAFIYNVEKGFINHTDHRKIGEAVMDAVYPLARDKLSFQHHEDEGLTPHTVKELCFGASFNKKISNAFVDVTTTFDKKIQALAQHKTQITDVQKLDERLREHAQENGNMANCALAEVFVLLTLS